tara:strand:- start:239 stop:856 length:618 start_codon:yes stop_codon:yes gene_type:complete
MLLGKLFRKYQCDKGTKHKYHKVYSELWESLRDEPINFLEIGIFQGLSTRAFLEYFPKANFYGIDIFSRLNPEDVPVLNNERVKWIKGDSMDHNIRSQIKKEWKDIQFDIILDDGKHTPEANQLTFKNISPFLKDNGMYLIEDVFPLHIMNIKEMNHKWIRKKSDELNYLKFQNFQKELQGWEVTEYDLRKGSKQPESYIFRITK